MLWPLINSMAGKKPVSPPIQAGGGGQGKLFHTGRDLYSCQCGETQNMRRFYAVQMEFLACSTQQPPHVIVPAGTPGLV
mgnify:CR=1 FL=1